MPELLLHADKAEKQSFSKDDQSHSLSSSAWKDMEHGFGKTLPKDSQNKDAQNKDTLVFTDPYKSSDKNEKVDLDVKEKPDKKATKENESNELEKQKTSSEKPGKVESHEPEHDPQIEENHTSPEPAPQPLPEDLPPIWLTPQPEREA